MRKPLSLSIALAIVLSHAFLGQAQTATPDALAAKITTPIAAQPLSRALQQLSRESGVQFLYSPNGSPRTGGAVAAGSTVKQALEALLAGTGLRYSVVDGNVIAIDSAPPPRDVPQTAAPQPGAEQESAAPTLDAVNVIAAHEVIEQKKQSPGIKDSVIYDDISPDFCVGDC